MTTRPQSRTWWSARTAPQRPPKSAAEYLRWNELDRMGVHERKPFWTRIRKFIRIATGL